MIPRAAFIQSLVQLAATAKPARVRMRTDMVHEAVLQVREKADDPKLLEDWLAIEAEPSRDGWQWVDAKYLTWAAQSLRRLALVLLCLLGACPLWAQEPLLNKTGPAAVLLATDHLFPPDGPSRPDPLRTLAAMGFTYPHPDVTPDAPLSPIRFLIVHSVDAPGFMASGALAQITLVYANSQMPAADGYVAVIADELVDTDPRKSGAQSGSATQGDADYNYIFMQALTSTSAIYQRAEAVCADVIIYLTNSANWCGLSTQNPGGKTSAVAWVSNSCWKDNLSLFHEADGHIFNADHDQANSNSVGYNHGYSWGPGRTVMAYPSAGGARLPYLSTPLVIKDGKPIGIADKNDNRRAVMEQFNKVRNFRSGCAATTPAPSGFGVPVLH